MKKNYFLLLFILFVSWLPSQAQTYKIQGSVIDKRTREPLEFVNVLVVGLNSGASTNSEGKFTIEQVPPGITAYKPPAWDTKLYLPQNIG